MVTLANFPMVSQLTTITSDGRLSENAEYDCVPAAIGAAILWYEGKSQWDTTINPDLLKDRAYGEALHNSGTAAVAYVDVVAAMGYTLMAMNGDPASLVQNAHAQLAELHPVVFTEPDPYVPASWGWSHVCVFFSEGPGSLTCLDPYIGKPVTRSDAEWEKMLLFNQLWIVERTRDMPVTIDITNPAIAKHFKELNVHQWQCTDTGGPWQGKIIQYAMLSNYKAEGNAGLCGYDILGRPMSDEIVVGTDDVVQFYEYGVRRWKAGVVRPCPLYDNGIGTDPAIAQQAAKATAKYNALQAQYAALQAQAPTPVGVPVALLADIQSILDKAATGKY